MTPRKAAQPPAYRPRRGAAVRDAATGFVGLFQAFESKAVDQRGVQTAFIRPFGGGVEVEAAPEMLREPTQDEILSAKVAAENKRSRERWG